MKAAVLIFHKNVDRYPVEWVEQCISSIRNQTFQDFNVIELDYGGTGRQVYAGSQFLNLRLPDHAQALNYLLASSRHDKYDCSFNVNIDDFYELNRFERQIEYIKQGYDIISSNFHNVDQNGNIVSSMDMASKDMEQEAIMNNNIIAHPVVCFSSRFTGELISSEIPRDDFELWKRCYNDRKYKFTILPDYLLHYRSHNHKVS